MPVRWSDNLVCEVRDEGVRSPDFAALLGDGCGFADAAWGAVCFWRGRSDGDDDGRQGERPGGERDQCLSRDSLWGGYVQGAVQGSAAGGGVERSEGVRGVVDARAADGGGEDWQRCGVEWRAGEDGVSSASG